MRATLKDIARETGFSVSTVSLALSGKESRLAKETIQEIEDKAKEMRYRPNQMALGLLARKTNMLGIVMPDVSHEFFSKLVKGANNEAEAHHYGLMISDTDNNPDKEDEAISMLLEYGADGIILISTNSEKSERLIDTLETCDIDDVPIVLVDRTPSDFPAFSVVLDQEQGGYLATSHLLSLGHKKIGCITSQKSEDSSWKRLEGYLKAMQEYDVPIDPSVIIEGDYTKDCGYELSKPLIANGATAIFAFNDLIAFGAYRYIREIGLSIPNDISLIGFDDVHFSGIIDPPLSTICQPIYDVGRAATSKLIRLINREQVESRTVFNSELVVRQSTGPL